MTKQELAAIESRANAATREPWISEPGLVLGVDGTHVPTASLSAVSVYGMGMEVAECQMDADGAFIAAARVDVPTLIAEVRRLRDERDVMTARLEAATELEAEVSGANRRLTRERDALQVRNSEFWDAPAVSRVEWDALRAERDALRKVYEAAEDFIGAQGTAYEADQYLMLCGVLKSYNAALAVQP